MTRKLCPPDILYCKPATKLYKTKNLKATRIGAKLSPDETLTHFKNNEQIKHIPLHHSEPSPRDDSPRIRPSRLLLAQISAIK